jgi:hypothetical protein
MMIASGVSVGMGAATEARTAVQEGEATIEAEEGGMTGTARDLETTGTDREAAMLDMEAEGGTMGMEAEVEKQDHDRVARTINEELHLPADPLRLHLDDPDLPRRLDNDDLHRRLDRVTDRSPLLFEKSREGDPHPDHPLHPLVVATQCLRRVEDVLQSLLHLDDDEAPRHPDREIGRSPRPAEKSRDHDFHLDRALLPLDVELTGPSRPEADRPHARLREPPVDRHPEAGLDRLLSCRPLDIDASALPLHLGSAEDGLLPRLFVGEAMTTRRLEQEAGKRALP